MDDPKARYYANERRDVMRWLAPAILGAFLGGGAASLFSWAMLRGVTTANEELSSKLAMLSADNANMHKGLDSDQQSIATLAKDLVPVVSGYYNKITCREFCVTDGDFSSVVLPGIVTVTRRDNSKYQAAITAHGGGPAVTITDEAGTIRSSLGVSELTSTDVGGTTLTPESTLTLFTKDGHVLRSYP